MIIVVLWKVFELGETVAEGFQHPDGRCGGAKKGGKHPITHKLLGF